MVQTKTRRILITICGRGGSKGLKNKNLVDFCGFPLVYYTLSAAMRFKASQPYSQVDIALNTDSKALADLVMNKYPEAVYLPRSSELSGDFVPKMMVFQDSLMRMEQMNRYVYDLVIDLDITSPLRIDEDIANAINALEAQSELDLIFTVTPARRNPYFNMVQSSGIGVKRVIDSVFTSRQQAPQIYDLNASIYVFRRDFLSDNRSGNIWEGKIGISVMKDTGVLDIDSEEDFHLMEVIASYLYKSNPLFAEIRNDIRK